MIWSGWLASCATYVERLRIADLITIIVKIYHSRNSQKYKNGQKCEEFIYVFILLFFFDKIINIL